MLYKIEAQPVAEQLPELYRRLTDGSIAQQKPDGQEIVQSMQRARIGADGRVRWTETCYCSPPLAHERQTVYDRYFTDMRIEPVEEHEPLAGQPFMQKLASSAARG